MYAEVISLSEKGYQWIQGGRFRHHSRDVLAVAITPKQTIASGGLAGDVHGLPLKSLIQTDKHPNCKKYPPFSPRALVSFSEAKRRFLFRRTDEMMEVWRAGTEVEGSRTSITANKPGEQGAQLQIADMPAIQARLVVKVRLLQEMVVIRLLTISLFVRLAKRLLIASSRPMARQLHAQTHQD